MKLKTNPDHTNAAIMQPVITAAQTLLDGLAECRHSQQDLARHMLQEMITEMYLRSYEYGFDECAETVIANLDFLSGQSITDVLAHLAGDIIEEVIA